MKHILTRRELVALSGAALASPVSTSEHDLGVRGSKKQPSTVHLVLDEMTNGRAFEGLGAVSGGGNTTRLLPDYPEPQRSEILDYLFKPGFAASLSILKVEVGGDVNSTEGSEPSHMHTPRDENYQRGFEWWLMQEAVSRNRIIELDCLAWGAPGWIGGGNFWSEDMMHYYIKFIQGAKHVYGLNITSVGGKNERGYDINWYIGFRKKLDEAGLQHVRLVASDDWGNGWLNIAKDAVTNPALAASIAAFAGHVTWSETSMVASPEILALNKPLWDSELHNYLPGFAALINLIHAFNLNYIRTKITRNVSWNLIWSYYPQSSYPDVGLIRAHSPWSGNYEVLPVVWGYAHVNQFVKPGWVFMDGGSALISSGGTYSTLMSPDGQDISILVETAGATVEQLLTIDLPLHLSRKRLQVWESVEQSLFMHTGCILATNGTYRVPLKRDAVYTITSTTGQLKGAYGTPPADVPLKLPYRDSYAHYGLYKQARLHYDYQGAFEIANRAVAGGRCLRQCATQPGIAWGGAYLPLTFLGHSTWSNYRIRVDVLVEAAGAVSVHGFIGTIPGGDDDDPPGYSFRINVPGTWELKCFKKVIAQGTAVFKGNTWFTIELRLGTAKQEVYLDDRLVVVTNDATYSSGLVGLGSGWNGAQYSNLEIVPL